MSTGRLSTSELPNPAQSEGLRARKKREQRRQLSDIATRLFLERGFGAVRVAEIAEACGVSEATVFNYFPTKESLILDRLDGTASAIVEAIGGPDQDPAAAVTRALDEQLRQLIESAMAGDGEVAAIEGIHRFGELIRSTPSLRAHFSDRRDRYTRGVAARLATRYHLEAHDPRVMIAATSLVGLWQVQSDSLFRHTGNKTTVAKATRLIRGDLEAAARLISNGLKTLVSS
jgi:AcrR family transcriptional regulator